MKNKNRRLFWRIDRLFAWKNVKSETQQIKRTSVRFYFCLFYELYLVIYKIFLRTELIRKNILLCKTDEEQGNTRPKQNQTYLWYVILERTGVNAVIRRFTP